MMNGSDGIDGRQGWEFAHVLALCLAGAAVLWCFGVLVLTPLLFHQGPDWVREGGFWARAAAACGLLVAGEFVAYGALWGFCRLDWKSPSMALLKLAWTNQYSETGNKGPLSGTPYGKEFRHRFAAFDFGIFSALVWEVVLVLIGRGLVASTFGVVAAFLGAWLLLIAFLVLAVVVPLCLVVSGRLPGRHDGDE